MARSTPERRTAFSRAEHPADALLNGAAALLAGPDDAGSDDGGGSAGPVLPAQGGGEPEVPAGAAAPAASAPPVIAVVAGEGKKQFVVRLPPSVHEALRNATHELREPMQAIAERGIVAELKRLGYTP